MTVPCVPNLPDRPAATVLCGDHPLVRAFLEKQGTEVITVARNTDLPVPVSDHADMICCHAGRNTLVTADANLSEQLVERGVDCRIINRPLNNLYPGDVALNCLVIGRWAFGRADHLAPELTAALREKDVTLVDVRQGYARCSVAVVDEQSVITADKGIAAAISNAGKDVLLISPGGIILEGYNTGFIGGCCGKLAADRMLFCGNPALHPDGERIIEFLSRRGVSVMCTHNGPLCDFGGFITLSE